MSKAQSNTSSGRMLESLPFKVSLITAGLMIVILAVFSAVFIVSERQKAEQTIFENGKTFANFSAQSIYTHYSQSYTHPQPEDFTNFKDQVGAILAHNTDVQEVSLIARNGRVLFHSSEFQTGKYKGEARRVNDELLLTSVRNDKTAVRQLTTDKQRLTEIVVPLRESSGGHIFSMRYVLSYKSLPERMNEVYRRIIITASMLLFFAVGVAVLLALRLTLPIRQLTNVAEQIRDGNFMIRAKTVSGDEIGRLAGAINEMAAELKASYENLEAKVRQRTKALELAQTELLEAVKRQEALLASIGDGVIATDAQGKTVLLNKAAEDMLQTKGREAIGRPFSEIWLLFNDYNEPLKQAEQPIFRALKTGETIKSTEYTCVVSSNADTRKFPLAISVSPVLLNDENVGTITVFRDITREKQVDRMKTDFISIASHQLRTPLSAISWFTEMLLAGDAGELKKEQSEYLNNISESSKRMGDLVNSLLNISRIESGRIMIDPRPTDLRELVNGIINDLQAKIQDKKHTMIVSVHDGLPQVNLDPRLIGQVYLNLMTNAIKYTPAKGEISVFVSAKEDQLISQVTDTGYGIPKDEQSKLFQKFFRAKNVTKVETDGTGLGMYLVKSIIESSGGKIWFESEEGKGTTFWFSLPLSGMRPKEGEVTLESPLS